MVEQRRWRTFLKRFLIIMGGFVLALILAATVIPFFVNVDQYRPQIVNAVNERLNGKLAIAKMSLSLWGKIEVKIQDIDLKDATGESIVSVKEAYAFMSFMSVLRGKPQLIFRLQDPDIRVLKDASGKMNIANLMKPETATPPTNTEADKPSSKTEISKDSAILMPILAAGIDFELLNANILFRDASLKMEQELKGLNVVLQDLSMTRPMHLRIWSTLISKMDSTLKIDGPFEITGVILPKFEGLDFREVGIDLKMNFDELLIAAANAFKKDKGVAANVNMSMTASPSVLTVRSLMIQFFNAQMEASAEVQKLQSPQPELTFKLRSQPINLVGWEKLLPMLAQYQLEGRIDLSANASGAIAKLKYGAKLNALDVKLAAPGLAAKPQLKAAIEVVTDELKMAEIWMTTPGTDLNVKASIKSFSKPQINVVVNSNEFDLDQLIPPPPEPPKPSGKEASAKDPSAPTVGSVDKTVSRDAAKTAPATNFDAMLEPLRKNEMLKSMVANIGLRMKNFRGRKLHVKDIELDFTFKDLVAAMEKVQFFVFGGWIKANFDIDIKPESPLYKTNIAVTNLDLERATASQLESLKNTMVGKLSFKAQGQGKSLNSDQIMRNLNLNGNLKITEAEFKTIDVGKMVSDGVNGAIADTAKKIPPLKDKKVGDLKNFKSRYEAINADFALKGGVFTSENFETISVPKEGIDVKGFTKADLLNDTLEANWMIIDKYDITGAYKIDVEVEKVKVQHVLAKGKDPVTFPVKVGCKLSAPCYDYAAVPKFLGEIAVDNMSGAAKERVKQEVDKAKKKAKDELKEKAKKELNKKGGKGGKLLKGLGL